ncbi:MAG TPA: 50S ribosomal protein L9 [Gemmatimonadales bacterium]|nr:50S ribosomal protein L9 [Gemmatimonadales bacterium]
MIEVILRDDVTSLGKAGELVRVRPGYARNYLLPQGLAYEATAGNRKRIEAETRARSARLATEKSGAEEFAARLRETPLTLTGQAGEEGKLFGSVTASDIAEKLKASGIEVDRRKIELPHPIKTLGEHVVAVRIHPEVPAEVRVTVVPAE